MNVHKLYRIESSACLIDIISLDLLMLGVHSDSEYEFCLSVVL
jgi:hypothetical protein